MAIKSLMRKCSRYYLYILITALLFIFKRCLLSLNEINIDNKKNIFGIEVVINSHILMKILLKNLGCIFFGIIFSIFRDKKRKSFNNKNNQISITKNIIKSSKNDKKIKWKTFSLLLIACSFFSIQLITRAILSSCSVWMLDVWVFNIVFIYIFMKYLLNYHIYKHQFYALIFIFATNFILLIAASSIKYEGISDYDNINLIYGSYYYIVLFYLIYLILCALTMSSQVIQKKLMDFYYISPYKILYVIGIISSIFTLIALIISSNVVCQETNRDQGLCNIFDPNDKNTTFFDNFNIYIDNMNKKLEIDKTSFYLEIFLVYPLYSFSYFIKYLYEILVIFYLNPNFVLLSDNIFYGLRKIILLIRDPSNISTYLKLSGEIISFIGYSFYLEIFEIECCGLNSNTKNHIYARSLRDSIIEDIFNIEMDENYLIDFSDKKSIGPKDIMEIEMDKIDGVDENN